MADKNYFATSDEYERPEANDDYYDRMENRSRFSMEDAGNFDRQFVDKILNYSFMSDSDKQNIANVVAEWISQCIETNQTSKEFEEFLILINGQEWYDNMIRKFLQKKGNEMAKQLDCPELYNGKGIFLVMPKEE